MSRKNKSPEDYEVGYGKPPVQNRFTPGKSGNPSGRKKKKPPRETDNVADIIYEESQRLVPVTIDGKSEHITIERLIIRAAFAQAARGSPSALRHSQTLFEEGRKSNKRNAEREIPDMTKMDVFEMANFYEEFLKIGK
jgi:hypothetical protein